MIKIESDNPDIEKNLRTMEKSILEHGGHLDPDLVIHCENGALSVMKEGMRDPRNPLIALPHVLMLPSEKMGLSVKDGQLCLDIEKGALSAEQERLSECMIDLYNLTNKVKDHEKYAPWFMYRAAPEALEALLAGRTLNENQVKFLAFTKGGEGNKDELLCDTYIKTRTIGYKQVDEEDGGSISISTQIMPIVDFVNHDHRGANFSFQKNYRPEAANKEFLLLQDVRPFVHSRECFAFYNHLDMVDTFLVYGFPDIHTPMVRSIPLEIELPKGAGKIVVNSYVSSWKKGAINKNLAALRPFIPQTLKINQDFLEVSHLIIPSGLGSPHALRRVLRLLIMNKAARKLDAEEVWNTVLDAERQVLEKNIAFYKGILERLSKGDKGSGEKAACYAQIVDIANVQLTKLYNYHYGEKKQEAADVAGADVAAALAG